MLIKIWYPNLRVRFLCELDELLMSLRILVPKLETSNVLIIKGHSRESKAFLKSRDTRILGMLCVLLIFHDVDYETDIFPNVASFYNTSLVRIY